MLSPDTRIDCRLVMMSEGEVPVLRVRLRYFRFFSAGDSNDPKLQSPADADQLRTVRGLDMTGKKAVQDRTTQQN